MSNWKPFFELFKASFHRRYEARPGLALGGRYRWRLVVEDRPGQFGSGRDLCLYLMPGWRIHVVRFALSKARGVRDGSQE